MGWCPEDKAEYLCNLIETHKLDRILEIGVFAGKSFLPMAHTAQRYGGKAIGIEPFDVGPTQEGINPVSNDEWWGKIDYQELEQGVEDSIKRYGLEGIITLLKMTSKQALEELSGEFGLIHQDSNHSEEVSFWETTNYAPLVAAGGFYVLDDIDWNVDGVKTNAKSIALLDEKFTRIHSVETGISQWAVWKNG